MHAMRLTRSIHSDAIHASHVDGDDRPHFGFGTAKGVRDVGAAAERNQREVAPKGEIDERLHLCVGVRKHNAVRNARDASVLDGEHLFLSMPVTMPKPHLRIVSDLLSRQDLTQLGKQLRRRARWLDLEEGSATRDNRRRGTTLP